MPGTENYRILIVDDTAAIHEDYRKVLMPKGRPSDQFLDEANALLLDQPVAKPKGLPPFVITSALQGQEGVNAVQQAVSENKPFAVAFVDVVMPPGIDGITTIRHMWAIDPNMQMVICTAYAKYSFEDISRILERTDQLFILKKPFDSVEIAQLACALTKRWNLNRVLAENRSTSSPRTGQDEGHKTKMKEAADSFQSAVDALASLNKSLKIRKP